MRSLLFEQEDNQELSKPNWITVGAFKDRLGMNALAIAVSTSDLCVAIREMMYDRKYIDLDRPDVAMYLNMLVSNNLPEAVAAFPGSGPLTAEIVNQILTDPVLDSERPD